MTASEVPAVRRPKASLIPTLRIVLPLVAAATLLAVIATAIGNAYHAAEVRGAASRPIELIAPQLTGEDSRNRPFVITATTAEREDGTSTRIRLHNPVLVRDQGGADQMRVTATHGVYDETAGKLQLEGDVKLTSPNGSFNSPSAVYDAKTGEVVGANAVQGSGATGQQLQAGSFAVKDKGESVIYKGGVHTRLTPKK